MGVVGGEVVGDLPAGGVEQGIDVSAAAIDGVDAGGRLLHGHVVDQDGLRADAYRDLPAFVMQSHVMQAVVPVGDAESIPPRARGPKNVVDDPGDLVRTTDSLDVD